MLQYEALKTPEIPPRLAAASERGWGRSSVSGWRGVVHHRRLDRRPWRLAVPRRGANRKKWPVSLGCRGLLGPPDKV